MRRSTVAGVAAIAGAWWWRNARSRNTPSPSALPGGPKKRDTRVLEFGADLLQGKSPVQAMKMYLDGFHFYADDMGRQMDTHQHELPLGIPALMMGFTQDGQLRPELVEQRDRLMGLSTLERRQRRLDIPMPTLVRRANSWQSGQSPQTDRVSRRMRGAP